MKEKYKNNKNLYSKNFIDLILKMNPRFLGGYVYPHEITDEHRQEVANILRSRAEKDYNGDGFERYF